MGYFIQYLVYRIKEISSISYYEYICLIGHYNKLLYKDQIDPKLLTRGFTEAQIKQMMEHRRTEPREIISCNIHFKGSLDQWEHPYFDYLLTLFNQYHKKGTLPFEGCHSNQPAKIIELFELLEQLDNERLEKQRREEERKRAKENRNRKNK